MAATTPRNSKARIEKRKRLEALFDRGDYVRFGRDADGKPVINPENPSDAEVAIWVSPPSPLHREMAVREAQAGRARTMIDARDNTESAAYATIHNFVSGLKLEDLIDYVIDLDSNEYMSQARRDVLGYKEWEDFDSLRDAMRQFEEAGSPLDDPEWKSLLDKDVRFGEQCLERAEQLRLDAQDGYKHMARPKLEEIAIDKRVEQAGSAAFMTQYEEWMLFYACRDDDDHQQLYFDALDELKSLPDFAQSALESQLASFITEVSEAKN